MIFRTTIINHGARPTKTQTELPMLTYDPSTAESTALAVFNQGGNAEYPYDSGLYFYPEEANLEYDLVEDMRNNVTGANKGSEPKENTEEESNEVSFFLSNYNETLFIYEFCGEKN